MDRFSHFFRELRDRMADRLCAAWSTTCGKGSDRQSLFVRIRLSRRLTMSRHSFLLCVILAISSSLLAQKPAWEPAPGHITLPLWPHAQAAAGPEIDTTSAKDNLIAGKPLIRLGNVTSPTITRYSPAGKHTGAAVVVFPGGGYHILAIDLEGTEG